MQAGDRYVRVIGQNRFGPSSEVFYVKISIKIPDIEVVEVRTGGMVEY